MASTAHEPLVGPIRISEQRTESLSKHVTRHHGEPKHPGRTPPCPLGLQRHHAVDRRSRNTTSLVQSEQCRPGTSHNIARVTNVSASLVSFRVVTRPTQWSRAYATANAYRVSSDGPRDPYPPGPVGARTKMSSLVPAAGPPPGSPYAAGRDALPNGPCGDSFPLPACSSRAGGNGIPPPGRPRDWGRLRPGHRTRRSRRVTRLVEFVNTH
jgi:hypothetical protein